jgi:hypothetical protein
MKKLLLLLFLSASLASSANETPFMALPVSSQSLVVLRNGTPYCDFTLLGFGPNWSYFGFRGKLLPSGKTMSAENAGQCGSATVTLKAAAEQIDGRSVRLTYDLSTSMEVPVTMIASGLNFDPSAFAGGKVLVKTASGEESVRAMPLDKTGIGRKVATCTLVDASGAKTVLTFDPACDIASDVQGRILLAEGTLSQPVLQNITVTFPEDVTFYASPADVPPDPSFASWYPFTPSTDFTKESEIGLQNWIEKPAGAHGRISLKDDKLMYNGQPIKLWGLNMTYGSCAPDKPLADRRAALYSKYGINAVRFHKFADGVGWQGIQSSQSFVNLDPSGLDRMDYFIAKLKEAGIYVTLSPNFGTNPGPEEFSRVPYLDELGKPNDRKRVKTGFGSIFLSRELQEIQFEQMVKFLTHKNTHTGMTYAEDPCVAAVELINEESVLFNNTLQILQKSPTLRQRTSEAFCDWLQKRYGSKEALLAAWGPDAINSFVNEGFTNESWEAKSIVPAGNTWFYDPEQLNGSQLVKKVRLLDTMEFLYDLQNDFYARYIKAIRDTGYTGEILASNWQAGRAFSHYYNLHSDALVGLIDRHNYFGGINGAKIKTDSMLADPGSAILSAGMQQVGNRPFMESEWVHKNPTEWSVEGPAIIGAYGMGLQGWDASFVFQNDDMGMFNKQVLVKDWTGVMTPQILGAFPAISRQVLRGDVQESEVKAVRYVHMPSLHKGKIGFNDRVEQSGDIKTFTSDEVPSQALAAVRCTVEFTDSWKDTPAFDLAAYTTNGGIRSATGQLFWEESSVQPGGYFTINSPATKAVVGFAQGQKCVLDDVTIEPESRFGAIYLSAKEADKTLEDSEGILVTAIARSRNTGTKILADTLLVEKGQAPLVMEPVKARITLKREPSEVYLLDHDGVRTKATLPVENGSFEIDGAQDKTCYYLITFD